MVTFNKTHELKFKPAIWSSDTGQQILEYGRHVAPRHCRYHSAQFLPLVMLTVKKKVAWFSISMHGCGSVLVVMGLRHHFRTFVRNVCLSTGCQKSLHHSASAPAFSSFMSSSATPGMPANSAAEVCQTMKKELLDKLEILSQDLPPNTLDELIDDLGGPDYVAEVRI